MSFAETYEPFYLFDLEDDETEEPDITDLLEDDTKKAELMLKELKESFSDYKSEILPSNGNKLHVTVNKGHAYPILDRLLGAYTTNQPPYNLDRVRLPQDPRHMPKTLEYGSVDHAMFMFNVCYYMRGGIKSNDAVKRMSNIYDDYPELFNCDYTRTFDAVELENILGRYGLGFQKTVSKQWIENSRRMQDDYEGDPRNIFTGVNTYEQSQELIKNQNGNGFIGFQDKMTSMIIYYLMEQELIEPFNFPIPIDIHVMRVSIANEMVSFADENGNEVPNGTRFYTPETLSALRSLYFDYAGENNVNPIRLCEAVWMLSESSCGKHPGNKTIEPLGRKNRDGTNTILLPNVVDISDAAQQKAYAESCAICPLVETCEYNIPGGQYYIGGDVIIRGRRVRFPSLRTFEGMEALF